MKFSEFVNSKAESLIENDTLWYNSKGAKTITIEKIESWVKEVEDYLLNSKDPSDSCHTSCGDAAVHGTKYEDGEISISVYSQTYGFFEKSYQIKDFIHDTSNDPIQSLNNTYEENAKIVSDYWKEKSREKDGCNCGSSKCTWKGSAHCRL